MVPFMFCDEILGTDPGVFRLSLFLYPVFLPSPAVMLRALTLTLNSEILAQHCFTQLYNPTGWHDESLLTKFIHSSVYSNMVSEKPNFLPTCVVS